MSTDYSYIPSGYSSVTPYLTIKGAAEALEFYKKAFGGVEHYRLESPDGKVVHSEIGIGNSVIMLSEEFPDYGSLSPKSVGGCPSTLVIYVPNADTAHAQAVDAGATSTMPVADQFWGDRMGSVTDPFGFKWSLTQKKENLTPEEIQKRFAGMSGDCGSEK